MASFTPAIIKNVKAKIYVVDEANNPIPGATVILYDSFENYKKEEHPIVTEITNEKGFAEFKNLQEIVYYILARKGDLNNDGGNNATDTLHLKGKNRFEIMIN